MKKKKLFSKLKLADLNVKDLVEIDFKKICEAFGVSAALFNIKDVEIKGSDIIVALTRASKSIARNE